MYCSNGCANDERKRQVEVECTGCGETFERRASLDTEYCSMACWGQDIRIEGDFTAASGTNSDGKRSNGTGTNVSNAVSRTRNTRHGSVENWTSTIVSQLDSSRSGTSRFETLTRYGILSRTAGLTIQTHLERQ